MTHTETLNLLDEIEYLVSDQLQVVSYKWLSRNFSISSETAKRVLKDLVEKHGKRLEVVYTVSGWLKSKPSDYFTRLVSSSQLPVVEKEFNGTCSVHVYSVQSSIPKDPVAIWNSEFVQSEDLFKQPSDTDNCLRDNSFCSISNSFVKRNIAGATANVTSLRTESAKTTVPSKSGLNCHEESIPKVGHQAKSEANTAPAQNQSVKSSSDKEKSLPVPAHKKNGQAEKSVTGTGDSLKNMWGRVPVKTEVDNATIEVKHHDHSEAQKPSHDADNKGGSDDETRDDSFRRASNNDNRKRKVIFDFSDEECEDIISLASPTSPKLNSLPDSKHTKDSGPDPSREIKTEKPEVSKEDMQKTASVDTSGVRKDEKYMASSTEKIQTIGFETEVNLLKGRTTNGPSSPKRKKVLKSRIDDRGREVTEVVWEETETNTEKKEEIGTSKKLNDGKSANAINRAVAQKKSPAIGNAASTNAGGKAGSKKGGNVKDPKQGTIMSFFKKV